MGCLLQMIFPICQLSEVPCNVCEVVRLFHWNVAAVFCKMDNNSPKFRDLLIEKGSLFREGLEEWISTKSLVNFKNKYHAFPIHSMPSKFIQRHILGRPLQNFPGWSGLALRSMTLCQMFCNKWCPSFHISTLFLPLLMCPHKGNRTPKWEYGNTF